MKKIYIAIAIWIVCSQIIAQNPTNRIGNTFGLEVLDQMPAEKQEVYNQLFKGLAQGGENTVLPLVKMIKAPGKGDNSKVDYALSGLTHYVTIKGEESLRLMVSKAYMKALEVVDERETRAFIIRQLQLLGGDECVETLADFIGDIDLNDPAVRALASIGTDKAKEALYEGLERYESNALVQMDILEAVASARFEGMEDEIIGLAESDNLRFRKVVYHTLSRIGSDASLKLLANAAKRVNYAMEYSGANESYIALIKRIAEKGNKRVAEKAANNLLKNATKADMTQTRGAALQILLSIKNQKEASALVLKSMNDNSKKYRNMALDYASDIVDKDLYVALAKLIESSENDVKIDIIKWFGREAAKVSQRDKIKYLMLTSDYSFSDLLQEQFLSEDYLVKEAIVWTMFSIGDEKFIPIISDLLREDDKRLVLLGQKALSVYHGNVMEEVVKVIRHASEFGKIACLEFLSKKKADASSVVVYEQLNSSSEKVRNAAYKALKNVVTRNDFEKLCDLLESADSIVVPNLQAAIIQSVASDSLNQQVKSISRRMHKSGDKKYLYYSILAATGDEDALALVKDGFYHGTVIVRSAAIDALVKWNGLNVVDVIYTICEKETDQSLVSRLLNRYVQLVSSSKMKLQNRFISLRKAMDITKDNKLKKLILNKIGTIDTYEAMLYAGNFLDDVPVRQAAANAVMKIALRHKEFVGEDVRNLLEKVLMVLDNPDAQYQRQNIRKHLDDMEKTSGLMSRSDTQPNTLTTEERQDGWNLLFDGKTFNGWHEYNSSVVDMWHIVDGCIQTNGKKKERGAYIVTDKQYENFVLSVDWKLSKGGNSGLLYHVLERPQYKDPYVTGPEYQLIDDERFHGKLTLNMLGADYSMHIPDTAKRHVFPVGEWNTSKIVFDNGHVEHWINGEKFLEFEAWSDDWFKRKGKGKWARAQEYGLIKKGLICLQDHGDPASFRNIKIKELPQKTKVVQLYDGADPKLWRSDQLGVWNYRLTREYFINFEVTAEVRAKNLQWTILGHSYLFKDKMDGCIVRLDENDQSGLFLSSDNKKCISQININKMLVSFKRNEWNVLKMRIKGDKLQLWMNGQLLMDVKNEKIKNSVGAFGLMTSCRKLPEVSWRNMTIRTLL